MCQARREGIRDEERRGEAAAAVVLESVSAPPCCPLSISSLAPPGTQALARPQEPGSQDQAKREKRGKQQREEKISQKKEKNRAELICKYCQAAPT